MYSTLSYPIHHLTSYTTTNTTLNRTFSLYIYGEFIHSTTIIIIDFKL